VSQFREVCVVVLCSFELTDREGRFPGTEKPISKYFKVAHNHSIPVGVEYAPH
jgi:hypothetical protein